MTTRNPMYKTKFHRDGTATVWNVYTQQWQRISAATILQHRGNNPLLPTLPSADRRRIERMAEANQPLSPIRRKQWL